MTLFQTIEQESAAHGLGFLIIGAHAVNQYGYSRDTSDIDLLIRRDDREQWLNLFIGLGYTIHNDRPNFLQLSAPREKIWPVDFMLVNSGTWNKLAPEAVTVSIGDATCKVPKLQHLIALKLHALKHGHAGRFFKDFLDVVGLIKVNHLDIASADIREIFERYGTPDLYEKVVRDCAKD